MIAYGWKPEEGYCFDYEPPENSQNVFITKEEWETKSKERPKEYYWNEMSEVMQDLEDAFDFVFEEIWDSNPEYQDLGEVDIEDIIKKKYLNAD